MKTYIVTRVIQETFTVDAESEENALKLVFEGEGDGGNVVIKSQIAKEVPYRYTKRYIDNKNTPH